MELQLAYPTLPGEGCFVGWLRLNRHILSLHTQTAHAHTHTHARPHTHAHSKKVRTQTHALTRVLSKSHSRCHFLRILGPYLAGYLYTWTITPLADGSQRSFPFDFHLAFLCLDVGIVVCMTLAFFLLKIFEAE